MRKAWTAVVAASVLALVLVSTPVVGKADDAPLRAVMNLSIDMSTCAPTPTEACHWSGTLAGDISGAIEIHEYWDQMFLPGATEHFFEYFTITVDSDSWIKGVDQGVWNLGTQKFRANGIITDASEDYADLIGYNLHEMGVTSGSGIVTGVAAVTFMAP